jgi:hypothetical protein
MIPSMSQPSVDAGSEQVLGLQAVPSAVDPVQPSRPIATEVWYAIVVLVVGILLIATAV